MKNAANSEQTDKMSKVDQFKWLVVLFMVIAGVVANSYYTNVALSIRAIALIIAAIVAILIALTTEKGKKAFQFLKESRLEMRKVVWPTRQETVQTLLVVIVIVLIMSLIVWAIDSLFALFVSAIVM